MATRDPKSNTINAPEIGVVNCQTWSYINISKIPTISRNQFWLTLTSEPPVTSPDVGLPTKQRLILQVLVSPRRHLAASRLQLEVELDGPIAAKVPDCCLAVPFRLGEQMHISADFRATFVFLS